MGGEHAHAWVVSMHMQRAHVHMHGAHVHWLGRSLGPPSQLHAHVHMHAHCYMHAHARTHLLLTANPADRCLAVEALVVTRAQHIDLL